MKNVILVDLNDNPVGKMEKIEAHEKPVLHRAFSIFLINENKILIQKRAKTKYHSAGLWANACCSHPETNDIFKEAQSRLFEELGIKEQINLKELYSFVYFAKLENLFEYELDHVLVGNYEGKIEINEEEAEEYMWVTVESLEKELIKNPKKFAPWFLICAPKVIKYLKNN